MSGSLTLLDGSTFFVTEANGDVDATRVDGLFHEDMRHLSLWQVRVDGRRLHPITTAAVDYYSGRIHAIPEGDAGGEHFPLSVRRDRFVTGGVHGDRADQPRPAARVAHRRDPVRRRLRRRPGRPAGVSRRPPRPRPRAGRHGGA